MSQQQQSEQPPQQPKQTNWLVVLVVTAIVGGIIQVLVNHFDTIAAFILGLFTQVHLPPLQGSPALNALDITARITTIITVVAAAVEVYGALRSKRRRLEEKHQMQITEKQGKIAEHLAMLQRNKRSSTLRK